MRKATTVYQPGVIAAIEQFTYAAKELKQFVIYTYYDKDENPLYVGSSTTFYDAHYFNTQRFDWFCDVKYVGFIFMENEDQIKDARKYYIKARSPLHNKRKCKSVPQLPGLQEDEDDLVVLEKEMRQRWCEWLGGSY